MLLLSSADFSELTFSKNTFRALSECHIRIYHECEGRIEKSVLRIAVWHHEACQVMPNSDPEGQIFLSYPHTNIGFFFLLTTVFFLILE